MTTVARQITVMSSLRMTPSPPSPHGPQSRDDNGGGIQSYVHSRSKDPPNGAAVARAEQKSSTTTTTGKKTKTVRIADQNQKYSPPPPPPPTRTTSAAQLNNAQWKSSSEVVTSSSRKFSESLNMSSTGAVITTGTGRSEVTYTRQRSNTTTSGDSAAPPYAMERGGQGGRGGGERGGGRNGSEDERKFNTLQGHSLHSRLNPNAAPPTTTTAATSVAASGGMATTTGWGMHSRFSTSQPQLHRIDHQATIVKPNDRIKMSMFDADTDDEKDGNWGEDYGSGYIPSLMKISHGEIQKHAVAVTTPIVPPTSTAARRNRAGSDPNLLDTVSRSNASPTTTTTTTTTDGVTPGSKVTWVDQQREEKSESPTSRERSSSLVSSTASSSEAAAALQTTPIARAYREYLIEKMDKERQGMRASPSSSSVSSGEAAVMTQNQQQPLIPPPPEFREQGQATDTLSSKIQSLTPSQLQSLDMPDRACLPRILPPPGMAESTANGKQEKWSRTLDNGGHPSNPFLAHSSIPLATDRDVSFKSHTGFSYGTLPRKRPSLPESQQQQVQSHMLGKSRTQSVNDLHRQHGGGDFPDSTQSTVEQMSAYIQSRRHATTDNLPAYSNSQEAPSAAEVSSGGWGQQRHVHYNAGSSPSTSASNSSSQSSAMSAPRSPGHQTDAIFTRHNNNNNTNSNWTPKGANQAVSMTTASQSLSATPTGGSGSSSSMNKPALFTKKEKPPVLPKPSNRKNENFSTPPNLGAHERSTSDPSLEYGQVGTLAAIQSGDQQQQQQQNPHSPSPSPMPLTPFPKAVSSFDAETMQLRQPPYNQSVQYGRPQKHRFYPGVQQSTSLLEIREADEIEEKDLRRMSTAEVKLFDYVSLNSSHLPKRVRISKGFCSDSTEVTMSQGEEFDLHFLLEVKSALVTDPYGIRYSIPLNSAARFSIVYDPFEVERVALSGFHFQTAGVIMDLKSPPIVVAATQAFDGGRAESSVEAGEILVVEGIKNVFHGRLLKVFSLRHNVVKYLDERCMGGFMTNPEMIKMSLAEVFECSIPLPQKVALTPADAISLPTTHRSNLHILRQFMMAKSVVATTTTTLTESSADPLPNEQQLPVISISLDLEVEVMEVGLNGNQLGKLRERTQGLLGGFDHVSVTPYVDMPTSTSYGTQCRLFSNMDPKLENYGVEIVTPSHRKFQIPSSSAQNGVAAPGRMPRSGFDDEKTQSRLQAMEGKYERLESKVTEMSKHIKQVVSKVDQIHTYLRKAQDTMTKHKKTLQEEAGGEQRKKRKSATLSSTSSSTTSSSTLPRGSLESSSSSQQLQSQHRSVSRSHSDDTSRGVGATSAKPLTSGRSSSKQPNISRTNSSKYASESESVDGGSVDLKVLSDEVFTMRPRSSSGSKPPIMPKPKNLKKSTNGGTLMQKLKAIKVTGKGKTSLKKEKNDHTPKKTVPASKDASAKREREIESDREAIPVKSLPASLHDSLALTSNEVINLKDFLIETDALHKPKPKPRPKPTQDDMPSSTTIRPKPIQEATPTTTGHTPSSPSPSTPGNSEVPEIDIDKLSSIGDDLTDWCLQVEDELTQLYNESILSSI